ncbi:MAG: lipopolysaccharide transport periplasmic protein LptA [Rhodospirillales bacterium]|nr:lipopolysaccharide transport periplasmic protein LptA [Rhodospirillales bacterium]
MRAADSRHGRALRLPRMALLAVVLAASFALAGAGAAQDADDGAGEASEAIEITADTLEVRQSENIAIFEGSVNAIQGDLVLNADMLTVHYQEAGGGQGNLGVSRIDAEGNVVVTSPGETAQGQNGVYDVEQGRIDLAGGVVLHQGNNIVEGETLTMNLETGVSRVSGAGSTRVHGLFVPEEEGE